MQLETRIRAKNRAKKTNKQNCHTCMKQTGIDVKERGILNLHAFLLSANIFEIHWSMSLKPFLLGLEETRMYCAKQLVPANNREQTGGSNSSHSFEELFGYRHNAIQFFSP